MQRRLLAPGLASLMVLMTGGMATLFAQQAPPERPRPKAPAVQQAPNAVDVTVATGNMRKTRGDFQLLLQNHPRLVGVLFHDPSLLADLDYVKRNGPDVAAFLEQHPEIAQNPEYFLGDDVQRLHDGAVQSRHGGGTA